MPAPHRLLFGVNDIRLTEPQAQAPAKALGLNRYALQVSWHPGLTVTGQELGSIPSHQPVTLILSGTPGTTPRTNQQRHAYANYARALTKAHPNIRELQVWNEPIPNAAKHGPFWGDTPIGYLGLLATTYDRMRGSGVKILSPGSQPTTPFQQQFVSDVKRYYQGSGRKRPLFDTYAVHPYWNYQRKPTQQIVDLMNRQWRGLPQADPQRGLKFWWTETGSESDPGGAAPPGYGGSYTGSSQPWRLSGTPQTQATRLAQVVKAAEANPVVGALFNFLLYDESDMSRWQSGLLAPNGQQKPAYSVLQQLIRAHRR